MRSAIIKKASKDEQQNQTTITTNITSKTLSIFSKAKSLKLNNKVKIASDKIETKQIYLHFTMKDIGPLHKMTQ